MHGMSLRPITTTRKGTGSIFLGPAARPPGSAHARPRAPSAGLKRSPEERLHPQAWFKRKPATWSRISITVRKPKF